MGDCVKTAEGNKKISAMRAAEKAFHEDWCNELHRIKKQLEQLVPQVALARIRGVDPITTLISKLPPATEAIAHHEALRHACINATVCYRCGGEAMPNVSPSMCRDHYEADL